MKSSKTKIAGTCALAVAAIGLSLAAASFTPAAAQSGQWCVTAGGTNSCYPTLAACQAANPGRDCVKGAS
jgi:hypothetical protein